jgi:hypothetical protein
MRLAVLIFSLFTLPALAAPSWAGKSDSSDEKGSLFVCSGEGKNEQDALDSSLALCNDKICKLCGVEVESTTTTNETLKGVDLQRKVVERCRRVRKAEPQLRSKSLECDDGKCQAYIQLFYSKETQKAECSAYANEDFADPAKCETDIEAFRQQTGLSAAAMRKRDNQLGAALQHCAQIDVRPTPALLALDEKLRVGLGNLSRPERGDARFAEEYAASMGDTMQQIAENKTLLGRIGLARGVVSNKVLLLDVLEAAQAEELDTPAGLARLLKTWRAAPAGITYGAQDVHFFFMGQVADAKSDVSALADYLRATYQPEKPPSGLNSEDWRVIARVLANDRKVTQAEWEWGLRAVRAKQCNNCLKVFLSAPEPADLRVARYYEALKEFRAAYGAKRRPEFGIWELLPTEDPAFSMQVEAAAPAEEKPFFDYEIYSHVVGMFRSTQPIAVQQTALRRWAEKAALPGRDGDLCRELSRRLEALQREEAPRVPALDQTVCTCLDGPLASQDRSQKKVVLQYALDGRLACVEAP